MSDAGVMTAAGTTPESWDGISLEILRSALAASCEEVRLTLVRSGRSMSLKERRDCSVSVYSPKGEMVVQAEHIAVHLGIMAWAMPALLDRFPAEKMSPGDCFVTNDPYEGCSNHLPDLLVSGPLFAHGQLVGFSAAMAHHSDVGGIAPRSMSATATEIYQEGLRIPPTQLACRGRLDEGLIRLLKLNSRTPDDLEGDLLAQVAGIRLVQRRIDEITENRSAANYNSGLEFLLDRSEEAMRMRLSALPEGEWGGDSVAEDGSVDYPIRVRVAISGGELTTDFDGTASQSTGPFNATLAGTYATVLALVRSLVGNDLEPNGGLYRPIHLSVPEGTILNPRHPAAVAASTQVCYHAYEALMRAFENLAPDRIIADSGAGGVFSWGGMHPDTGRSYAYGEAMGGGLGASACLDGENAVMPPISRLRDTPVEALEMQLPVRIERYELIRGSGGDGQHRGGMGIRRVIRMLAPATWSVQLSMSRRGPLGIHGGRPGTPTRCTVVRSDGTHEPIRRFTTFEARAGDVVFIETAGGGGYGPPTATGSARDVATKSMDG